MQGFKSFKTENRCLKGIEAVAMIMKQQSFFLKRTLQQQVTFVHNLFGLHV